MLTPAVLSGIKYQKVTNMPENQKKFSHKFFFEGMAFNVSVGIGLVHLKPEKNF